MPCRPASGLVGARASHLSCIVLSRAQGTSCSGLYASWGQSTNQFSDMHSTVLRVPFTGHRCLAPGPMTLETEEEPKGGWSAASIVPALDLPPLLSRRVVRYRARRC